MVAACYRIWEENHPKVFVLESNGFQRLLKRDFDAAARTRGFSLPIKLANTRENKNIRIERQVSLHDSGDILFCREEGDTALLLEQLYEWEPMGSAKDDGPDALAGALEERRGRPRARFHSRGSHRAA